jgi:hypothetical protein
MHTALVKTLGIVLGLAVPASGWLSAAPFDAVPFGIPLPAEKGIAWEDPREIHRVVVRFEQAVPPTTEVRVEYWGSRWPQQRLPKDREPGGGDVGWMELGNWYRYGWRRADTEARVDGRTHTFTFRPVNAREFPKVKDYPAAFRYTLKIRVAADQPLPAIERLEAFTDSSLEPRVCGLAFAQPPTADLQLEAFNGTVEQVERVSDRGMRLRLMAVVNPDPNTFDRTLVTARHGTRTFTFAFDDLAKGPLYLPRLGVVVAGGEPPPDYADVAAAVRASTQKSLYDRVAALPEQTWKAAWDGMPPKKTPIYFPLGLDGGRQRFRLNADGSIQFRSNDHYLKQRPGLDTPRLELEAGSGRLTFGLPGRPVTRTLEEESLPIVYSAWDQDGLRIEQTAFVTALGGLDADGPAPPGDTFTVFLARFTFTNPTDRPQTTAWPWRFQAGGDGPVLLRAAPDGLIYRADQLRGQVLADTAPVADPAGLRWSVTLAPGQSQSVILKFPYVVLVGEAERLALTRLDFDREHQAAANYWRRRLDQSARLITPEPMLNEFYRSHAMHLLVNCEREPGSDRRFARVGSFSYGAYGNESCMMVSDLDRRGYHQEARECLDAWRHYQGTVALPGDFASKEGVLYGAGGYEAGGYNQHHGWILWCLAEHYRFTGDTAWLAQAAPNIVAGANWIIRETERTADRHPLERGLLPAGSLEDIGDWWTWLSTSCYTWRGLDAAAWALEQLAHPEATRIRQAAQAYHQALVANFRAASERSPVVRLRDGTAVPKFPSQVHRRGRSFGWICETLEGSLHLLITRALDPRSPEADAVVRDYEDNLFLSNQYGYTLDDFDRHWFGRGGMSMQACLLLNVEPYLYRDDVKHALRAVFNALAASYFPDVRLNTEHALPFLDDWRGDHFKSSDEANAAGWLRSLFVREDGKNLLLGQAVPREWLKPERITGLARAATHFGPVSVLYTGGRDDIIAKIEGPRRQPPQRIHLRFRAPGERRLAQVTVNGEAWYQFQGEWVYLPGDIGNATIVARF